MTDEILTLDDWLVVSRIRRALAAGDVRAFRESLGIPQSVVARACKISRETWGLLERGQERPSPQLSLRIAPVVAAMQASVLEVRDGFAS